MDDVESDEEVRLQVVGQPCLGLLDTLTVEVRTPWGTAHKYQCAGAGCQKQWAPRTTAHVFAHAKRCLKLTEQHHLLQQVLVNHLVHWSLQITFRKVENLKLHLHYNLSQALSHLSCLPLYLDLPLPSKLPTVSSYCHRVMVSLVTRVGKKYIVP